MSNCKRILLISHEMTYTGAPNSLLNMAKLLRSKGHDVCVFTLKPGDFLKEFTKTGFPVAEVSASDFDYSSLPKKFDAVIANTIFCGEFALKSQKYIKTFLYIREGENLNDIILNCNLKKDYINLSKNTICISEYAKKYIEKNFNPKSLSVIHNYLY